MVIAAVRRAFIVCAIGWAAAVPLASFAASRPSAVLLGLGHPFALGVYSIGAFICHQRTERSFALFGVQMPICARCTGIYLGAAVGAIVIAAVGPARAARDQRLLLVLAAVPTAITLAFELATGQMPSNWIRGAAGVPLGAAVAWVMARLTDSRDRVR